MNVFVITSGSLELAGDMSTEEVLEGQLWPQSVHATLNGAMRALEEEIADYAAEQLEESKRVRAHGLSDDGYFKVTDLPLTVEWKAITRPVPKGATITGRMWQTENPFTEETLQVHEMVLQ